MLDVLHLDVLFLDVLTRDDKSTLTSHLPTDKCTSNSKLSAPNANFLFADIKYFFLNTKIDLFEYMRLKMEIFPKEIIEKYNLRDRDHEGWVYIELQRDIYGLPQVGILASKKLIKHLEPHGYEPAK